MKTLLEEQAKRRKRNRGKTDATMGRETDDAKKKKDRRGGWVDSGGGAMELSSLVKSLRQKVSKNAERAMP